VTEAGDPAFSPLAARRSARRQAVSIGLAVAPFGLAFGVACTSAGLSVWQALAFSSLVFTGASQFAAVSVLSAKGAALAAIAAGVLLSLRSLAYGFVMAPALRGPTWWRALASQLMIDEAMAVGTASDDLAVRRYGYLWGGCSVFVAWNLATVAGAVLVSSGGEELIRRLGIDATIPAAFLALIWPRLADPVQRAVAAAGAAIALVLIPLAPAGIPILAASLAIGVAHLVDAEPAAER
jgi:predicted branched-subunit amino acid permease